jgi:hypothetical protein
LYAGGLSTLLVDRVLGGNGSQSLTGSSVELGIRFTGVFTTRNRDVGLVSSTTNWFNDSIIGGTCQISFRSFIVPSDMARTDLNNDFNASYKLL